LRPEFGQDLTVLTEDRRGMGGAEQ
jgi:hypothetical protein